MQGLLNDFKTYTEKEALFLPGDTLLLAVSGGIDSVVLCEIFHLLNYRFAIAHCNFQLRGEESEKDEAFVRDLAKRYSVPVWVKKFETEIYAAQNKISIQVAARTLRYGWFNELLETSTAEKENRLNYIVTAHHSDDNIETVLMNFFKGTGITGMRGMLPKTGRLIRPLLFSAKKDLLAFAEAHQLAYREDSSNASDKYSRNYIRHQVVPLIEKLYPGAGENLIANINRFRDTEILYMQAIAVHKKRLLEYRNNEVYIPLLKLLKTDPLASVVYEIAKDYDFSSAQAEEIISLLHADTGKFILSATHRILKNRNWLIISPLQIQQSYISVIEKDTTQVLFEQGILRLHKKKAIINSGKPVFSTSPGIATFDLKDIRFPLLLRRWKTGDYFYPLGMAKKKKLSRFFIDQKLSLADKEKVWVLEMNKKIIWVVNYRIDDRFKITDSTKEIIQVTFNVD
jgi:tRNA(Ile)-lysidine synthase